MAQWVKESTSIARDTGDSGLIPVPGRFPGEGNGKPLQCSCLGQPMDRGAWWASVHGVAESDMIEQLGLHACLGEEPEALCGTDLLKAKPLGVVPVR